MILIIKGVIIGIIQGVTYFLPISSETHIILLYKFLNLPEQLKNLFFIVTQMGAILGIVSLYSNKLKECFKNIKVDKWGLKFCFNVFVVFYPLVLLNSLLVTYNKYFNLVNISITLIAGGILLLIINYRYKHSYKVFDIKDLNTVQSINIGILNCLAIIPGISQPYTIIIGSLMNGICPTAAIELSCFAAIPYIFNLTNQYFSNINDTITFVQAFSLFISFLISFLLSYVIVKNFIKYVERKSFNSFGIYRILLGCILLIFTYFKVVY